ncbi:hypothetical protein NEIG_02636, partial [Nematocida sp. ERTm5]
EYLPGESWLFDIFGSIILCFEAKDKKENIKLDILPKYSKFSLVSEFSAFSDDAKNELVRMQRQYNPAKNYIERIVWNYLNNSISRHNKNLPAQNYSEIVEMVDKMKTLPNYIFLCGRIDSLCYKMSIINYCLTHNTIYKLSESSQILRITSNIIGSIRLDNPRERKMILLAPFICNSNHTEYYPKIEYNTYSLPISELRVSDMINVLDILIHISESEGSFQKSFRDILEHAICHMRLFSIFRSYKSFEIMCVRLVKKYKPAALLWTLRYIKSSKVNRNNVLNEICFLWLSYACINTPYNLEVISHLYKNIDPLKITDMYIEYIANRKGMNFNRILMVLEEGKGWLCLEANAESMAKYERMKNHFKNCDMYAAPGSSLTNPIII